MSVKKNERSDAHSHVAMRIGMRRKNRRVVRRSVYGAVAAFVMLITPIPAQAGTFGSSLAAPANGSICEFQSLEPSLHGCTISQRDLSANHSTPDGLVAPFDGVVIRWSVLSGTPLPGTGTVKLALRTLGAGYQRKGPEVELPVGSPGRHTFAEKMSISAGQKLGLTIAIANRNTQEAGAPIVFREPGVGSIDTWTGEPLLSMWDVEEDAELLMNAEIEPDADHDGYGDLTQDCFLNRVGQQELCGRDLVAPTVRPLFASRQAFARKGAVLVRVAANEAGVAKAEGRLEVKGPGGQTYGLRGARAPVSLGGQALLRLRLGRRALTAARAASREGKKMLVTANLSVLDGAGNEGQATVRVRPPVRKARG